MARAVLPPTANAVSDPDEIVAKLYHPFLMSQVDVLRNELLASTQVRTHSPPLLVAAFNSKSYSSLPVRGAAHSNYPREANAGADLVVI